MPTESVLETLNEVYLVDMDDYRSEFLITMSKAQRLALGNTLQAQESYKRFCDKTS